VVSVPISHCKFGLLVELVDPIGAIVLGDFLEGTQVQASTICDEGSLVVLIRKEIFDSNFA
jgi:hypothetical protein